jgi:hypothetical protein
LSWTCYLHYFRFSMCASPLIGTRDYSETEGIIARKYFLD